MKRVLALVYGVVVYAFFFVTFLYAIGFVGNAFVPKAIDTGAAGETLNSVLIDALLLGAFAIQHSVMARQGFKRQWTRIVAWPVERTTYVLVATAILAMTFWQWHPLPQLIWQVSNPAAVIVLKALFLLGWTTVLISTFLVNHFELFGLEQVYRYFRQQPHHPPTFRTPGLYRFVRHPIYVGFVVAFWSAPTMTAGHLLFSVATTGYILVGIYFEERDLISHFGQAYETYRQAVPMLLPRLSPAAKPEEKESKASAGMR